MAGQMTHWERVRASLKNQEVDRVPISMWRHFFKDETSPETLAEAMLAFQNRFDWDFMKVNPRASYHVEDWGVKVKYEGDSSPKVVERPVKQPEDWLKLEVLPLDKGVLKEQLDSLEIISHRLDGKLPFLMTVFTPLSIASRLVDSEEIFLQHLHEHTVKVQQALDVITETFTRFSKACLGRGASGLFYATTAWATTQRLTEEEYLRFARPYDLKLLDALPPAEFHILHVCRDHNLLPALKDYPVHAFNWDARALGNLSLAKGKALLGDKAVIGGIPQEKDLVEAAPQQLAAEVWDLRAVMGNQGWMLGTGCTYSPEAPEANIDALRRAVQIRPTTE